MTLRHFFPSLIPLFIVSSVPPPATCKEKHEPLMLSLLLLSEFKHSFKRVETFAVSTVWLRGSSPDWFYQHPVCELLPSELCATLFLLLLPLFSDLSLNYSEQAKHSLCISQCWHESRCEKVTYKNCALVSVWTTSALCLTVVDFVLFPVDYGMMNTEQLD